MARFQIVNGERKLNLQNNTKILVGIREELIKGDTLTNEKLLHYV